MALVWGDGGLSKSHGTQLERMEDWRPTLAGCIGGSSWWPIAACYLSRLDRG